MKSYIEIYAYVTDSDEMAKEGYVHERKGKAFFVPRGGIKIVREMIKKHNYSELLAENKIIAVKKVHICRVVVGEKGIESLWKIKRQTQVPGLIECLNKIKAKGKLSSFASQKWLGSENSFVEPGHPAYMSGVVEMLKRFDYRLESFFTIEDIEEEEIPGYHTDLEQGKAIKL